MKHFMKYKDYYGSINYDDEQKIFYGKVEFIRSLISYEGDNRESLKNSFEEAIDDYLELCHSKGLEPETSFNDSLLS